MTHRYDSNEEEEYYEAEDEAEEPKEETQFKQTKADVLARVTDCKTSIIESFKNRF